MVQSTTFLFLEAFTKLVTVESVGRYDWIARTGKFSLYALLSLIAPEVWIICSTSAERKR